MSGAGFVFLYGPISQYFLHQTDFGIQFWKTDESDSALFPDFFGCPGRGPGNLSFPYDSLDLLAGIGPCLPCDLFLPDQRVPFVCLSGGDRIDKIKNGQREVPILRKL